jgi:2-dehydro-3-deoxygluconokinase
MAAVCSRASSFRRAVLQKGAFGATVYSSAGVVDSPGFTVDVVDTVGAGDAFVAGYLSGLLDELDGCIARTPAAPCCV